jgi:catechol 2,3-dioxygenase-like lactoylglutathione lyase family enzyme
MKSWLTDYGTTSPQQAARQRPVACSRRRSWVIFTRSGAKSGSINEKEIYMNQTGSHIKQVDMRHEVDVIPVANVERSKQFYQRLGWRLDADDAPANDIRIVQFTPPGSACSVTFGKGITPAAPGSAEAALVVSDIKAAHDELVRRGIDASDVWHGAPFPKEARLSGPDPKRTSYGSFFSFTDPDGNTWLVQEVTTRLPGRV